MSGQSIIFMKEKDKAVRWVTRSVLFAFLSLMITLPLGYPIEMMVHNGFNKRMVSWAMNDYFGNLLAPSADGRGLFWVQEYGRWIKEVSNKTSFPPYGFVTPFILFLTVLFVGIGSNPYPFNPMHKGGARKARDEDVKEMGLFDGWIMVLGMRSGKFLMFKETLSALCVAPPGTGKTVGIVIPTIFTCDDVSMIINDVKPELADLTSGYRSKFSTCLRLEWAASDRPEEGVFYPRWNPLSPKSIPEMGPNRDLFIDRLVNVIIEEPKGDADPHWTKKGRASLSGFIHYLVSKTEHGNYDSIPEQWYGEEACLPMLLDWITEATLAAQDEIERLRQEDPNAALFADPIKNYLIQAVKEARQNGYSPRCILELTQLANTPDKERGSILSTMDAGLNIFKNSAVRARTCKSDFSFLDVRGMRDPVDGKMKPLTLYICVNQEDAKALGIITGLLVETLSAFLVAHRPGSKTRRGEEVGPYPVMFVLDEFPQMPKLQALIDGPAVGRGQKVCYLMIGQDLGQVAAVYGKDQTETIISTTAAKVILPLNNENTADRFSKMIGGSTDRDWSDSRTEGLSKNANPFAVSRSYTWVNQPLYGINDFMTQPKGTHVLLYQNFSRFPIVCDTPFYFKHPKLKHLVNPENGGKYPPAAPMPQWMVERRLKEEGYIEVPQEQLEAAE